MADNTYSVAVVSLLISLVSVIITYVAARFQVKQLLSSQLSERANTANRFIGRNNDMPKDHGELTALVAAIITAEEILYFNLYSKRKSVWFLISPQHLIDEFYLQLHTSIRRDLAEFPLSTQENYLQEQWNRCKRFLAKSILKNKNQEYHKLQYHSQQNNRNAISKLRF